MAQGLKSLLRLPGFAERLPSAACGVVAEKDEVLLLSRTMSGRVKTAVAFWRSVCLMILEPWSDSIRLQVLKALLLKLS